MKKDSKKAWCYGVGAFVLGACLPDTVNPFMRIKALIKGSGSKTAGGK
jgi:hypothetical protein